MAKRFFEIGSTAEITSSENQKYLEDELVRLKTTAWFLEKFKSAAKESGVEFSSGKHDNFWLIRTHLSHQISWSPMVSSFAKLGNLRVLRPFLLLNTQRQFG